MQIKSNSLEVSTSKIMSLIRSVSSDEFFFLKTDMGSTQLVILSRPKRLLGQANSFGNRSNFNLNLNSSNELFDKIIEYLIKAGVEAIVFEKIDDVLHIWSVIDNYDDESKRRNVYTQESLLMKNLKEQGYSFNFQLIRSENLEDVLSSGGILIYKKR
jgi:methionine synthase I (cobalamin-dependent)